MTRDIQQETKVPGYKMVPLDFISSNPAMRVLSFLFAGLHVNALIESQDPVRLQHPIDALWKSGERIC